MELLSFEQICLELHQAREIWGNKNTTLKQMDCLMDALAYLWLYSPHEFQELVFSHILEAEDRLRYMI